MRIRDTRRKVMNLENNILIILDYKTTISLSLHNGRFTICGQQLDVTGVEYDRGGQCQLDLARGSDLEEHIKILDTYHLTPLSDSSRVIINDTLLKIKELGYHVVNNKSTFEYMQAMYVTYLFGNEQPISDWLGELPTYKHDTILREEGITIDTEFSEIVEYGDLEWLDNLTVDTRHELFVIEDNELYSCNFSDPKWDRLFDKMCEYYVDLHTHSISGYGTNDWKIWESVIEKEKNNG